MVMLQLSLHDVAYNITTEEIRLTNFSHALMVGDKELVDLDADTLQSITTPPDMTAGKNVLFVVFADLQQYHSEP